jgi:hypothetical protein
LAKKAKAEVPKLIDAAKAGDARGADEALRNINDLNKKLADLAKQEVEKEGDAAKSRKLDENLQEIAATTGQLASEVKDALENKGLPFLTTLRTIPNFFVSLGTGNHEKLANTAKALYDPLENIAAIVNDKDAHEYGEETKGEEKKEEAKKQAKVILATLRPKGGSRVLLPFFLLRIHLNILKILNTAQPEPLDKGFTTFGRPYGRFSWKD